MLSNIKQTTKGPQAGGKRSAENPGFQDGKRRRLSNLDDIRVTSRSGTKSITKARTNDHVTYPYNLAAHGELGIYVKHSYMHPLLALTNYSDEGESERLVDARMFNQHFMAGFETGSNIDISVLMNMDPFNRHFAAGGPAVALKLPVMNFCIQEVQKKFMAGQPGKLVPSLHNTVKDLYALGICITDPIEQDAATESGISMVEIYRAGHKECFNIWCRPAGENNPTDNFWEEPPIGTPLFFVLKLIDLDAISATHPQFCVRDTAKGGYDLSYILNSDVRSPKTTYYPHRYLWQVVPWYRQHNSLSDYPDLFRDTGGWIKTTAGPEYVPGAYWKFGYAWQRSYKNAKPVGFDYMFNVRHIESGAVSIVRANTKTSFPVIGDEPYW